VRGSEPKPGEPYLVICSACLDKNAGDLILNENQVIAIKLIQYTVWFIAAILWSQALYCVHPNTSIAGVYYALCGMISWFAAIYIGLKLYMENV
jgi:hypothetical protein